MGEALHRAAEVTKLARLLGRRPDEFGYLDKVPPAAIHRFREQATDRLFDGERDLLHRAAAASTLVPIPVSVHVVQRAVGPLGAAALSGLVDADRAVRIAERLPVPFLAEVAIQMDPRRATAVIARMPPQTVADVGVELIGRGEHVTMGRFVGFLPRASLEAAVEVVGDADLLQTAFVLEDKSRLDELTEIARDRLPGVVRTAHEHDLWHEALDLLQHLSERWHAELGDITAAQSPDLLDSLIRAAHRSEAFDAILPLTAAMSAESLRAFAAAEAACEEDVLRAIVETTARLGLWPQLLPLAEALPEPAQRVLERVAAELDEPTLRAARDAAREHGGEAVRRLLAD